MRSLQILFNMMDGEQLAYLIKSDFKLKQIFVGIYPRDLLPKTIRKRPAIIIINTDVSSGPGQHWVVVYLGLSSAEYFDSYGLNVQSLDILTFIHNHSSKYVYNDRVIQHIFSLKCGLYCLYYALKKARGANMVSILKPFKITNPRYNEKVLIKLLNNFKIIRARIELL